MDALKPPADALWNLIVLARAAAVALRQLHGPEATPSLVEALDHRDLQVRYQGVIGLAALYVEVGLRPAVDLYAATESGFVEQWKTLVGESRSGVGKR